MRFPKLGLVGILIGSVSIVLTGTIIAQVIALSLMPVVSRIYSPAAFGAFQVLASTLAVLLPVASLRLEPVLLRLRSESSLPSYLGLCIGINIGFAAIVFLGMVYGLPVLIPSFGNRSWVSWSLPAMIIAGGILQTVGYLPVRERRYRSIAISKVAQTTIFNGGSVLGGAFASIASPVILVLADVAGRSASAVFLIVDWLRRPRMPVVVSGGLMLRQLRAYRRYPIYSVPSSLIGALSAALPVFWLSAFHSTEAAGQFGMAWRSGFMPLTMITFAVGQVVSGRLSQLLRERQTGAQRYVARVSLGMAAIGAFPLLAVAILAEPLLSWVLGAQWAQAGRMVQAMVPLLLSALLAGPIGMVLVIAGRPDVQLGWDLTRLALLGAIFYVTMLIDASAVITVGAFSGGMLLMGIVYFLLALHFVEKSNKAVRSLVVGAT